MYIIILENTGAQIITIFLLFKYVAISHIFYAFERILQLML